MNPGPFRALDYSIKELTEAKKIIADLLKVVPSASCECFHHAKQDRHEFGEECPPLTRYMARIARAKEFIAKEKNP